MVNQLDGKRIAFLVADGFEQVELTQPKAALERAGATCDIVSPNDSTVKAWNHKEWGDEFDVDVALQLAEPELYDALVLPGGVMNPDILRTIPEALSFVSAFVDAGKIVGAICHGPWTLIDAGVVTDKRMTSWPSLRQDLINAGADWVDIDVVTDGEIVTSRKPADIPAFNAMLIEEIGRRRHHGLSERRIAPRKPGART